MKQSRVLVEFNPPPREGTRPATGGGAPAAKPAWTGRMEPTVWNEMNVSSMSLRTTASSPWPSPPKEERETAPRPGLAKPLDILGNPKGIASLSPGLRAASYPGFKHRKNHQPCKGCSTAPADSFSPPGRGMDDRAGDRRSNPFRVDVPPHRTPRVARASRLRSALRRGTAQPLGFEPESLWDSHRVRSRPKSSRQAQSVGLESGS
jgi:hypothetical protein